MSIEVTKIEIAGGSKGWGGLVNREDRMGLLPNQASDCLNVWDDNGILRKRRGYDGYGTDGVSGFRTFEKVAEYDPTKVGVHLIGDGGASQLAQEVNLGTTRGGDYDHAGGERKLRIEAKIKKATGATRILFKIFSKNGATGAPDQLLVTGTSQYVYKAPFDEHWAAFDFDATDIDTTHGGNVLIVIEADLAIATTDMGWVYGNSLYSGAEKAWKYSSGSWSELVGDAFKVRVYQLNTNGSRKLSLVEDYIDERKIMIRVQLWQGYNNASIASSDIPTELSKYNGATLFIEGERFGYEIYGAEDGESDFLIKPYYPNSNTTVNAYIVPKMIMQQLYTNYGLEVNHFSEYPVIIHKFPGVGGDPGGDIVTEVFKEAGKSSGIVIIKQLTTSTYSPAPLIWGTDTYPLTGFPGEFSFTGLTNPITSAETVMFHKNHMIFGGVKINGNAYLDRIYYSGIGTVESGYGDNRYDYKNGNLVASLSLGKTAVIFTTSASYVLYGDYYENFEYVKLEDDITVTRQSAICKVNSIVYGISNKGIFELDGETKKIISENISEELTSYDRDSGSCWYDGRKNMVMFALTKIDSTTTTRVFGYKIKSQTWWIFDTPYANGAVWTDNPFDTDGNTVGAGRSMPTLAYEYDSGHDNVSDAINAYYKTAPFYAAGGGKFNPSAIWLLARNEDATATLTVDAIGDYTTEQDTVALRVATYPDNAPVSHQVYLDSMDDCNSIEVKVSQNTVDQDFSISSIAMDAEGGQNVDQTV
jgi:hypothetical protein